MIVSIYNNNLDLYDLYDLYDLSMKL